MSDRERGPYSPSADDPILTFDAREEEDTRRGPFILIAAVGFLILFTGVIWNFYRQGVREGGREATPTIAADASPYKTAPADPGGVQTPDQDKAVLSAVGTASAAPVRVETVDTSEEPMVAEARPAAPVAAPTKATAPPAASAAAPKPRPQVVAQATPPPASKGPTDLRPRMTETTPAPAPKTVVPPVPAATPKAVLKAPQTAAPATKAGAAPASGGSFSVQLGAFGSKALAEAAWKRYAAGGGFGGRTPSFQSVERDGKTLTRLRTGGFSSRADAQAFCAKASAAGAACIVAS
jgi:cell division protein FtsN